MTDTNTHLRHEVAVFRYGLIADFVHLPPNSPGLYQRLQEKAAADYTIPGTPRTRVAAETLRDWLKRYRRGGFDALMPKPRADCGRSRGLPPEVVDRLLSTTEDNPQLSVRLLIQQVRQSGALPQGLPLPPSTVHRLLARHGLIHPASDEPTNKDRRRFAFARAGQLWMSDVMHGPSVGVGARVRRKTYLIAFLDDATRAFLPPLKQALLRRGFPERLYVDNGANYRSHHLALVCCPSSVSPSSMPARIGRKERAKSSVSSARYAPNCLPA